MHISPALAKLNADRFRDFDTLPERPAMFAFAGDVYTGLEAKTLDEAAVEGIMAMEAGSRRLNQAGAWRRLSRYRHVNPGKASTMNRAPVTA